MSARLFPILRSAAAHRLPARGTARGSCTTRARPHSCRSAWGRAARTSCGSTWGTGTVVATNPGAPGTWPSTASPTAGHLAERTQLMTAWNIGGWTSPSPPIPQACMTPDGSMPLAGTRQHGFGNAWGSGDVFRGGPRLQPAAGHSRVASNSGRRCLRITNLDGGNVRQVTWPKVPAVHFHAAVDAASCRTAAGLSGHPDMRSTTHQFYVPCLPCASLGGTPPDTRYAGGGHPQRGTSDQVVLWRHAVASLLALAPAPSAATRGLRSSDIRGPTPVFPQQVCLIESLGQPATSGCTLLDFLWCQAAVSPRWAVPRCRGGAARSGAAGITSPHNARAVFLPLDERRTLQPGPSSGQQAPGDSSARLREVTDAYFCVERACARTWRLPALYLWEDGHP